MKSKVMLFRPVLTTDSQTAFKHVGPRELTTKTDHLTHSTLTSGLRTISPYCVSPGPRNSTRPWSFPELRIVSQDCVQFPRTEYSFPGLRTGSPIRRIVPRTAYSFSRTASSSQGSRNAYHLVKNDYSFDALQFDCFRINIKL